jgi:16S rRNA U516 pseudouridylate synthase RsuA-like enzyme
VTIREGRNRQVRKMCDAIGHPVAHLKRVAIGPIRDPGLKIGRWRELREDEVRKLRAASERSAPKEASPTQRTRGLRRTPSKNPEA